jgi:hypothetical protein
MMRSCGVIARAAVVMVVLCSLSNGASTARGSSNIYAVDLKAAKHHEADARAAWTDAVGDLAVLRAKQPGARRSLEHWKVVAQTRWDRAHAAQARADEAQQSVTEARTRARDREAEAGARLASRTRTWQRDRATWIAAAWLVLAALLAVGVAVVAGAIRRREPEDVSNRGAVVSSAVVGGAVAVYLMSLIGLLWLADAAVFVSLLAVSGAAAAVMVAGLALGWRRPAALARLGRPVLSGAIAVVGAAVVAAVLVGGLRPGRPAPEVLPVQVVALAADARTAAPLPQAVRDRGAQAAALKTAAKAATDIRDAASQRVTALSQQALQAVNRRTREQRAIDHWTTTVRQTQADYDEYQRLLDDEDSLLDDPASSDESVPDPLDDLPDETGVPDVPVVPDAGSPTTGDFGSGTGSVGLCNDGTTSDSVGRQGACSHHGGVAR